MVKEQPFFNLHPYESIKDVQSQAPNAEVFSLADKLAALEIAQQEDQVVTGSVGWGVQTGLSLETILRFARDIDIQGYSSSPLLDSGQIVVADWQKRMRSIQVSYEQKEYSLLVAHYLDIALTTCFFLQEQPLAVIEYFQALKILKWAAALIHIYLYSLKTAPDKKWDQEARTHIVKTLGFLQEQLSVTPFNGNEKITAAALKMQTEIIFKQLLAYLPAA